MLYSASLGHAFHGKTPDLISSDPGLFEEYMWTLTTAMNRGPLTAEQAGDLDRISAMTYGFKTGADEAGAFRGLAVEEFGFPGLGDDEAFNPDRYPAMTRWGFRRGVGSEVPSYRIPTNAQVQGLIRKIQEACCN